MVVGKRAVGGEELRSRLYHHVREHVTPLLFRKLLSIIG
jgi:hypothetical protein